MARKDPFTKALDALFGDSSLFTGDLDSLHDDTGKQGRATEPRQPTWKYSSHQGPSVDLVQHDDKIVLLVDLPGMDKQDIKLDIQGDRLCISGTRAAPADVRESQQERWSGPFERKVRLHEVDHNTIEASMDQGVLTITIPRARVCKRDQPIKIS